MKTSDRYSTQSDSSVIEQAVGQYCQDLKTQGLSPRSIELYQTALKRFQKFFQSPRRVQEIRPSDLEAYCLSLVEQGIAPASMYIYVRAVRQFFGWLVEKQKLFVDPAARLKSPKVSRKLLPVPSEEEVCRLLSQPDTTTLRGIRDRAILETAYSTGARRRELWALQVTDINLEEGLARVHGKGSKERMVPLGSHALTWIKRYLKEVRPQWVGDNAGEISLWINKQSQPLAYAALGVMITRHARRAGLPSYLSWHSIRRACATHMLRRGAHPQELQLLLGHAGMKHLSPYLRMTITEIKAAHAQSKPGQ